jgi:hypothetical protein
MRRDPTMISLALMGAGFAIAGVAIVLYAGGYFSGAHYSRSHFALVWLIALYPLTFISVFFNVALASAAGAHFDGRRLGLGEALRAAYDRIDRIALWALLSAGVGLLISEIANRLPGGGRLVGWLMGAAWGLATIFAVPLLALEDARPVEALRGSAHLVKSRWGEGLTGVVGIGAWTVIALIPVGVLIGVGATVANSSPAAGIPIIALGLLVVVVIAALTTATRQVFAVALYRYATDTPVGGFAQADLEHPFELRKRRRTRTIAWAALGLLALLFVLAAISHSKRAESGSHPEGLWDVSFRLTPRLDGELRDGMPVIFRGQRVGHVVERSQEGSEVALVLFVDPNRRGVPDTARIELNYDRPAHPYLRLLPTG